MAEPGPATPAPVDQLAAALPDLDWPVGDDWETFAQTVWTSVGYGASLHRDRAVELRAWARLYTSHHVRAAWDKQPAWRHASTIERLRWLSFFMWSLPEGDLKGHLPAPTAPPAAPPTRRTFLSPRDNPTPDEQASGATGAIVLPDGTRHLCRGVPLGTALFGASWLRPAPRFWPQPRSPSRL
ncbi:hypothetical protein JCM8208_004095 [Rhodotorula glutinis]